MCSVLIKIVEKHEACTEFDYLQRYGMRERKNGIHHSHSKRPSTCVTSSTEQRMSREHFSCALHSTHTHTAVVNATKTISFYLRLVLRHIWQFMDFLDIVHCACASCPSGSMECHVYFCAERITISRGWLRCVKRLNLVLHPNGRWRYRVCFVVEQWPVDGRTEAI